MRREWRRCLNAGTTGDSISTRRIPICHTVPWQPSYCLNSLNSGGMYCGVPEWKQITLTSAARFYDFTCNCRTQDTPAIFPPRNFLKGSCCTSEANPKSINLASSVHMSTRTFSGLMSRWRTPVSLQLMLACRIWAKYRRSTQSVSVMYDVKQVFADFRSFHDVNIMLINVYHFICRLRDDALLGAEGKPRREFLPRLSEAREEREG